MNGLVKVSRSTVWNSRCTAANAAASSTHAPSARAAPAGARAAPSESARPRLEERRLDEEPQCVDLLARAQRGGRDDDAVVRRRDDEPVALQPAEGVAERRAADAEHLHQPGVREPLAGRIRAVDDQVAQPDVRLLRRVARAEQRARRSAPSAMGAP